MVDLAKTAENFKHLSPGSIVYLVLIIICLLVIIVIFKYSIAKKAATAKDKATQASKAFTPKFLSYFFG